MFIFHSLQFYNAASVYEGYLMLYLRLTCYVYVFVVNGVNLLWLSNFEVYQIYLLDLNVLVAILMA